MNQKALGAVSLGMKQAGHEADRPPSSTIVLKARMEIYLHSPVRHHGLVLN
jgi:hypothetical protein